MSEKLVIKGHPTRGKEVIELLEMMGGNNRWNVSGGLPNLYYFISNECIIYSSQIEKDVVIFTLEKFLEKYPYKVGDNAVYEDDNDIVVISEIMWDDTVGDIFYNVKRIDEDDYFLCPPELLKPYKETNMNENKFGTVKESLESKSNAIKLVDGKVVDNFRKDFCERCGSQRCSGQDDELEYCERFKNLIKEEMKSKREHDELRMPLDDDDKLATEATIMGKKILPPDGYLVGKITQTDNGMLVEYVEKKPVYPKTYKECCDVLLISPYYNLRYHTYERGCNEYATSNTLLSLQDKLNTLGKLIICRDAYWKILGEQMELGKPWKPKFGKYILYSIKFYLYQDSFVLHKGEYSSSDNCILVFPTEEIRDTFYENFKDLIEQCKNFL